MADACLCFQVHLPARLISASSILGVDDLDFCDHAEDGAVFDRMAETCYLPASRLLGEAIEASSGRFRIALLIGGSVIRLMRRRRPDVLESFQQLVASGGVELLAAPWHHSLAFLHSNREFDRQVDLHLDAMEELFHVRPRVFHNTDLIYNDAIAAKAETMGFDGVMADICVDGTTNRLCRAPETARIKTLPRHGAFTAELEGNCMPESADFASRIARDEGDLVLVFPRYEALAGVDGSDGPKTRFWETLPSHADDAGLQWVTPSEAVDLYDAACGFPCNALVSCGDPLGGKTPWEGNARQYAALERIHGMEKRVHASRDPALIDSWAFLQAAHHFHWMSGTRRVAYENPYGDPAEGHARVMAALDRIEARLALYGL